MTTASSNVRSPFCEEDRGQWILSPDGFSVIDDELAASVDEGQSGEWCA